MAKIMTIRPPEELHQKLKETAQKGGYTMNGFVLQILWDWSDREDEKNTSENQRRKNDKEKEKSGV